MARRPVYGADCETDPFKRDRVPKPFIWGLWTGSKFYVFNSTEEFINFVKHRECLIYMHNGGKFDFMFLLTFVKQSRMQVINGRIISIYLGRAELRDSFAIMPEALEKFGGKKHIEYWKMEKAHRTKYRDEIVEYLYYDCKSLYEAVINYRSIAGTHKTIASNAMAFGRKLGIDPGRTNHHHDEKYRKFYYGGRCECFMSGVFHNIHLLDIHSAYPYAMLHKHATGHSFVYRDDFSGMSKEEIQRSFIILECTSHGAFPKRVGNTLEFPHDYDEYKVTGWEYLVAREYGLIENEKIISVRATGETIDFSPYVNHWYAYKASFDKVKNPVEYVTGKIMQNSYYGKLGQNLQNYYDYKIVPAGTKICRASINPPDQQQKPPKDKDNPKCCAVCGDYILDHGWQLGPQYEGHEIHRRESMWRIVEKWGVDWEGRNLYYNVATGASITGFTRAHLLRATQLLGPQHVIYLDTDGIACTSKANLSALPFSPKIGDWNLDDTAPVGYFAGKKLYGVQLSTGEYKIAAKGSRLAEREITKIIDGHETTWFEKDQSLAYERLIALVNGETIMWDSQVPTFKIDGSADFIHRKIRATARTSRQPIGVIHGKA